MPAVMRKIDSVVASLKFPYNRDWKLLVPVFVHGLLTFDVIQADFFLHAMKSASTKLLPLLLGVAFMIRLGLALQTIHLPSSSSSSTPSNRHREFRLASLSTSEPPLAASSQIKKKAESSIMDNNNNNSEELLLFHRHIIGNNEGSAGVSSSTASRRQFLVGGGTGLLALLALANPAHAALVWNKDPVNKRSGVKVVDAERDGYNLSFVTYLTRFLLSFDPSTQKYWFQQLQQQKQQRNQSNDSNSNNNQDNDEINETTIPSSNTSTSPPAAATATQLFAKLAASVEIGLQSYTDSAGPARLLRDLTARYGPAEQKVPGTTMTSTTTTRQQQRRQQREAKEAQRQLALLFALLEDRQPVLELTQLLAAIDNGRIVNVTLTEPVFTTADPADPSASPQRYYALVPPPPAVGGQKNNYTRAQAEPVFSRTGRIAALQVLDGGSGFKTIPTVQINGVEVPDCKITLQNGKVSKIELLTSIMYHNNHHNSKQWDDNDVEVTIVRAYANGGTDATVRAIPEVKLERIDITNPGSGYLVETPVRVYLTTDPSLLSNATADDIKTLYESNSNKNQPKVFLQLVGKAVPQAERSSYTSFRQLLDRDEDGDDTTFDETTATAAGSLGVKAATTGPDSGLPPLPFWSEKSTSADLLRLLPAGIGLLYDRSIKRYVLAVDPDYQKAYPANAAAVADLLLRPTTTTTTTTATSTGGGRPLGPEFGPRGRAPLEKNMEYSADVLFRLALSGAICSSAVHVVLTPLDVVKTKVQTNPKLYPTVPISFRRVYRDEGLSTFYSGWLPTLLGNFFAGGALYLLTEVIRKYLTEAVQQGSDVVAATTYEVPIILAAAATASAVSAMIICPFEAVRIRGVAQPQYAPNSFAVLQRLIRDDGIGALVNTIPVFLVKNVPYAMTKFTIFDLSTEQLFAAFPAAQEELRWSLLISLLGGILGGTAAAVVSNPADALISELKKSQRKTSSGAAGSGGDSGNGPIDVAQEMWRRGDNGPRFFFKGLGLRMVFAPLVASLQFCLYDFVRFSLGIGPDDLKLYLDVLGGALSQLDGSSSSLSG
jgi:solute carrier family 25 (mitochondrial phosphate transporter), member 3